MIRKSLVIAAVLGSMSIAAPASATWWGPTSTSTSSSGWTQPGGHKHKCGCGHLTCNTTTTTTTTSTSSGTQVPEPGMLGLAGIGLMGLSFIRLRRRKAMN